MLNSPRFGRISSFQIFLSIGLNAPPSSWITIPEDRGSRVLVAVESFLYSVTIDNVVKLVSRAFISILRDSS